MLAILIRNWLRVVSRIVDYDSLYGIVVIESYSCSKDINRSSIVVMPMYVQLVEFYDLMNISCNGYTQITIYGCTL
jgi:hypothetical protein